MFPFLPQAELLLKLDSKKKGFYGITRHTLFKLGILIVVNMALTKPRYYS